MSERDEHVALRHMLDHAREAVALVKGKNREALSGDRVLQLALTRLIEIVGEAATRVPESGRSRYPDIPWPQIIGMRNRLIHGYDFVDVKILWDTIDHDVPELIRLLEKVLGES